MKGKEHSNSELNSVAQIYLDIRLTSEASEANPSIMTYCEVPFTID